MKITCIDIEVALMTYFDYRRNIIVPNITNQMGLVRFEADLLSLNKNRYATAVEIKVSLSDLKADFKKPHHNNVLHLRNGKNHFDWYYGRLKHFYYAVPPELTTAAQELIPSFCGLIEVKRYPGLQNCFCTVIRKPKKLSGFQWSEKDALYLAHLGCMRIRNLKRTIITKSNNE